MKKITLASFVLMVLLVTGVSALVLNSTNENLSSSGEETNSQKAKDDFTEAENALGELEGLENDDSSSNGTLCRTYMKIQRHCRAVLDRDDDSSDKDDDSSDAQSDDNVSDYQSKVQNILNKADEIMNRIRARVRTRMHGKVLNCNKEIECEKKQDRFMYQLHGDDNSNQNRITNRHGCDDMSNDDSSDDKSSNDDDSSDDKSSKDDDSSDDKSSNDGTHH